MTERGRYVMSRGWQDHPVFKAEPFTEREAWEWLISEAAFEDTRARVGRTLFDVSRGQLVHAYRFMAAKWKWSEARVRRFLERLKREGMVTISPSAESTRITICNYDEYQFPRRAGDAPATRPRRREEESNKGGGGGSAPRPSFSVTTEALAFADELAEIAGHDPTKPASLSWFNAQPGIRVQMMLDQGWQVPVMRDAAKRAMLNKRHDPPGSIRYFEPIFARAHAPPLPLPSVKIVSTGVPNGDFGSNRPAQRRGETFAAAAVRYAREAAGQ